MAAMLTVAAIITVYVGLTVLCALAYFAGGMSPFDAIGHAFTTISTGGFSIHDESLAYFHSQLIETIAIFFMLAGGINFAIHFIAFRRLSIAPFVADSEVRSYGRIYFWATLFIAVRLYLTNTYAGLWESLRQSSFQTASILTSTGFTTATFSEWPLHVPLVLVMLSFTGGCAGSTAGGIKVIRLLLLLKLGIRQLFSLAYPHSVTVV